MGGPLGLKFLWHNHGLGIEINLVDFGKNPNGVGTMCKRRPNSIVWACKGAIFENLENVKMTLDVETLENYEFDISPTYQVKKLWLDEVFL